MFLRKTVIFLMSKNMAHIKLLAFKEYESHYSENVICNINNIMLIKILEVIQRWEKFSQCSGRRAVALFNNSSLKREALLCVAGTGLPHPKLPSLRLNASCLSAASVAIMATITPIANKSTEDTIFTSSENKKPRLSEVFIRVLRLVAAEHTVLRQREKYTRSKTNAQFRHGF